jgi:hypothetical protein
MVRTPDVLPKQLWGKDSAELEARDPAVCMSYSFQAILAPGVLIPLTNAESLSAYRALTPS